MSAENVVMARLETDFGEVVDDPSEDAIFETVGQLDMRGNTFLTIEPTGDEQDWYVVISLADKGGFEVELRDSKTHEHELFVSADRNRIAANVTIWIGGRPAFAQRRAESPQSS